MDAATVAMYMAFVLCNPLVWFNPATLLLLHAFHREFSELLNMPFLK